MNPGWQELLLIVVIVLLIFGAKRVPEIFRSLGSGIGEFKKGLKDSEPSREPEKSGDKDVKSSREPQDAAFSRSGDKPSF